MSEIPRAEETKEKALSAGVSEEQWNTKVEEYKAKFGGSIATQDFLYFVVAQQAFGLEMPQITTLDRRGSKSGPSLELKLRDATADFARRSKDMRFKLAVWIFGQKEGKTGKNTDAISMRVTDGEYAVNARVQGDKPSAKWRTLNLKDGDYIEVDGADLYAGDKSDYVSMGLGIAEVKPATPPKPLREIAPDAWKRAIPPGGLGLIQGYVTAEENKPFQVCMACHTSVKNIAGGKGKKCCGSSPKGDIYWRRLTVTNGDPRFTLTFTPDSNPASDVAFYGKFISALAVYNKDNEEFTVLTYTMDGQVFLKKHEQVFSQSPVKPSTPNNVAEIFDNFVRRHGEIPEVAVLRALKLKLRVEEAEAKRLIEEQVRANLIGRKGTNLVWAATTAAEPSTQSPPAGPLKATASNGAPTPEQVAQLIQNLAGNEGAEKAAVLARFPDYAMLVGSLIEKLKAEGQVFEPKNGVLKWVG